MNDEDRIGAKGWEIDQGRIRDWQKVLLLRICRDRRAQACSVDRDQDIWEERTDGSEAVTSMIPTKAVHSAYRL